MLEQFVHCYEFSILLTKHWLNRVPNLFPWCPLFGKLLCQSQNKKGISSDKSLDATRNNTKLCTMSQESLEMVPWVTLISVIKIRRHWLYFFGWKKWFTSHNGYYFQRQCMQNPYTNQWWRRQWCAIMSFAPSISQQCTWLPSSQFIPTATTWNRAGWERGIHPTKAIKWVTWLCGIWIWIPDLQKHSPP